MGGRFHLEVLGGGKGTRRTGRRGSKSGPHQTLGDHRHRGRSASPGVPARKEVRRRVQARPRRGNGEEAAGDEAVLAAHHRQTLAGVSQYWSEGEGWGKSARGRDCARHNPSHNPSRGGGIVREVSLFPPELARATCRRPKSPALRRAKPSSPATSISCVREQPGGGGGFGPHRPGRGRQKWSQTLDWALGSVAELTGHPIKHARGVCETVCSGDGAITLVFSRCCCRRNASEISVAKCLLPH